MISRLGIIVFAWAIVFSRAAAPDFPFFQDRSEQFPAEGDLAGATLKKVHVNKDGIVYVLTDRGMARLFGNKLALDRSFRPMVGKKIIDSWIDRGEVVYRLEDELFSNGQAGEWTKKIPGDFSHSEAIPAIIAGPVTNNVVAASGRWRGTGHGLFSPEHYYASRRWLLDDSVVSIDEDRAGDVYALTQLGLNKIVFEPMTLEQKAMHYEDKIRKRHIRFGFCSELRLSRPGDPTSAEMIDTDNDGTWTEYYLASQAFRFGATGDEQARRNAWETFAAMERLEKIAALDGFPARTFERKGYKVSDPDRWRDAGDGLWEWKGHTSSDEIIAHMFGCSALWECAAKTKEEKARIGAFVTKIADHLLRNNLYLIDVDGKPTLWGRWNPEYVNWFPHSIVDRRLNSAEIIGLLEFAFTVSGDQKYKAKAMELFEKHGYLENILWPMKDIALTKGFIHQGNDMGDEWNHSDDLLSFDAYWVLYRYAFDDDLKKKYAAAIRDHWEMEREEKNPLFAFVYASTKPKEFDLEGALWTLRRFPWDMVDWTVQNSHRLDVTKLPENFRQRQLKELLPPGERRITRWNSHPFVLDGGSGGHIELAGDEYLLPYWLGRYLKIIAPPERTQAKNSREPVWP